MGFDSQEVITRRWMRQAEARPDSEAIVHLRAGEPPYRWTWARLMNRALELARVLEDGGVLRGQVCALVVRHHRDFYPLYIAVELLGAIPAVLAYPNPRLHPDKFRAGLEGMARHSGLDWLLTESSLDPIVRPLAVGETATIRGVLHPLNAQCPVPDLHAIPPESGDPDPTAPCLLQHSSGTTGLQKAVMLSHQAVLRHIENYSRAIDLSVTDRIVSWLPLYHDMGLIAAFHLPLATGTPTVQMDPFEWIAAPVLYLEALWRELGTLGWLPNFAYNLMTSRIHDEEMEGVQLEHVRMLINCSEPVRADSLESFARRFAAYGLRPQALGASYAMAETTFAVSQTEPDCHARTLVVARDDLRAGTIRPPGEEEVAREVVSSGKLIPGCQLKVLDEGGQELADGRVGQFAIRSESMFAGYRGAPEKTASVLHDGWYRSGDYGFLWEGEVYVIGRKNDLIIIAGKNLYPEDIEDAVGAVDGILPGRVVAFGVDDESTGTQQVWVAAETQLTDEASLRTLRARVVEAGMRIDVTISVAKLVPPRWLIKSSAGKLSRSANRDRLLRTPPDERNHIP